MLLQKQRTNTYFFSKDVWESQFHRFMLAELKLVKTIDIQLLMQARMSAKLRRKLM